MTVKDRADRRRIILAFWLRRMWRLWPSAWLWLGLPLLGLMFFNESRAFGTLAADFAGIFNYVNIRFAQIFMREEIGVSFLYTSLSLEEQLYLLFPLLIVLAPSPGHPATSTGAGRRALLCPLPDPYTAFLATRELFYRLNRGQTLSCELVIAHVVCALLLTIIAGELNFRLIETLLRKYGTSWSDRLLGSQPSADMFPVSPAASRS